MILVRFTIDNRNRLVFYGNTVGYVKDDAAVVDEMFQTDELSRYLARLNLTPQWKEGVFDRLAASAVKAAKHLYPDVKLILLLPYHPAERPIPTPDGFDNTFYPPGMESVPRKIAIVRANRYVVDHVDYLIAYAWHPASNAWELVEYGRRRKGQNHLQVTKR